MEFVLAKVAVPGLTDGNPGEVEFDPYGDEAQRSVEKRISYILTEID